MGAFAPWLFCRSRGRFCALAVVVARSCTIGAFPRASSAKTQNRSTIPGKIILALRGAFFGEQGEGRGASFAAGCASTKTQSRSTIPGKIILALRGAIFGEGAKGEVASVCGRAPRYPAKLSLHYGGCFLESGEKSCFVCGGYSARRTSMGFCCAAFHAGYVPNTTPTKLDIASDERILQLEYIVGIPA